MSNEVKTIIERIGRADLTEALQVQRQTLTAAIMKNEFPSAWYFVLKAFGKKKRVAIPDELFTFKKVP